MFGTKWVLIALALVMITGCGGGGGGSDDGGSQSAAPQPERPAPEQESEQPDPELEPEPEPEPDPELDPDPELEPEPPAPERTERTVTTSIDVEETASVVQAIDGEIQATQLVTGSNLVSLSEVADGVRIEVSELQNSAFARFEVISQTEAENITTFISVNGINTSALPLLDKAASLTELPLDVSALRDDERLTRIVLEVQYLAGDIQEDAKNSEIERFIQDIALAEDVFRTDVQQIEAALTAYEAETGSESELASALADADTSIQLLSIVGEDALIARRDVLEGLGVQLPVNLEQDLPLVFDDQQGRYTRFTHPSLGAYNGAGDWEFSSQYDFLNAALQLDGVTVSAGEQ